MSAPLPKNQNAIKSPFGAADSHLHIRVTRTDKARWVRAAAGHKLSEWVVENLNRASSSRTDHKSIEKGHL